MSIKESLVHYLKLAIARRSSCGFGESRPHQDALFNFSIQAPKNEPMFRRIFRYPFKEYAAPSCQSVQSQMCSTNVDAESQLGSHELDLSSATFFLTVWV